MHGATRSAFQANPLRSKSCTLPGGCSALCTASHPGGQWPTDLIGQRLRELPRQRLKTAAKDKSAAVLVPLCLDALARPSVLLCVRAAHLRAHAGEICFPGGRADPGDADAAATALREAQEELGLEPAWVTILGEMSPVLSSGRMAVTPVVGAVDVIGGAGLEPLDASRLVLNSSEVAAAFALPLEHLLAPGTLTWHELHIGRESMPRYIPAFRLTAEQASALPYTAGQARPPGSPEGEVSVWGMTGFVLHSLLSEVLQSGIARSKPGTT